MLPDIVKRIGKGPVSSPLMMEGITYRMPVQDLTRRSIIRRDDDPLVSRQQAPQADIMCIADKYHVSVL